MTIIFFFKCLKFAVYSRNGTKQSEKLFLLKIIAFELGTTNSRHPEEDTCHWQSICYETPLRFTMTLKDIFWKSGSLRVMKKYDGSAHMQILYKFGTF